MKTIVKAHMRKGNHVKKHMRRVKKGSAAWHKAAYQDTFEGTPAHGLVWERADKDHINRYMKRPYVYDMGGEDDIKERRNILHDFKNKNIKKSSPFNVVFRGDSFSGSKKVAGPYESKSRARHKADKLDNEYGAYKYAVVEVD